MAKSLDPNTAVLIGPRWVPGFVIFSDHEGIHVMTPEGDYSTVRVNTLAIRGAKPREGGEAFVEVDGAWKRAAVLDVKRKRARVELPNGPEWVALENLAVIPDAGTYEDPGASAEEGGSGKDSFGTRWSRFGWRYGGLVLLAFGALAPVFGVLDRAGAGDELMNGWGVAGMWLALHVILAAYVHAQNRTLPRFHPAGFGKPTDPGGVDGFALEHPPVRGKWEMVLFLIGGWIVVGVGAMVPGTPSWIAPAYLSLVGVGTALLAYFHDRESAQDARRLLGARRIQDGAATGEGCLVGTVTGEGEAPTVWRQVLLYAWSVSRQVTKTITDANGNQQTVNATETSHYACGLRRQHAHGELRIDSPLGTLEVPLRGAIWATQRDLQFGRHRPGWQPPKPESRSIAEHCNTVALERIHPGDRVAVLGEVRRDKDGDTRVVGGASGPTVLFATGEGDPLAVLGRDLLRRRALLATMAVLGLATFLTVLL